LPDGFRGGFAIRPYDPDAIELVKEDGRYTVRIPESGILGIRGHDPFRSYLCTASFANGDEIWVSKRIDDSPGKGQVALWGGITEIKYDKGQKQSELFWWFVGTDEDWNSSTDEIRSKPGGIKPQ
jgi:hypothetical protein